MKQVLLLAAAMFSIAQLGSAAPCAGGKLSDYVTLGAGGCTIGGNTLADFQVLAGTFGATELSPTVINISPTGGNFNPGLTISLNQTANPGTILEIIFTYRITGLSYSGSQIALGSSSETVDGAVTGIENYCVNGTFGPDGVSGCGGVTGSLTTLDGIQQTDQNTFANGSSLGVTDDFLLEGGFLGSASGGTLANSFTAVPEPVSILLTAIGLAFAGVIRFRRAPADSFNS